MGSSSPRESRTWPGYIFGGRMRTSTAALLIAFFAIWWLYETYEPAPRPQQVPASEVVPPGFIPDPDYTWAPRTDVQRESPATTPTTAPTTAASVVPTAPGNPVTGGSSVGPTGTSPEPQRSSEPPGPTGPATQTPAAAAEGPSTAVVPPPQ